MFIVNLKRLYIVFIRFLKSYRKKIYLLIFFKKTRRCCWGLRDFDAINSTYLFRCSKICSGNWGIRSGWSFLCIYRAKYVSVVDDFDDIIIRRSIHKYYNWVSTLLLNLYLILSKKKQLSGISQPVVRTHCCSHWFSILYRHAAVTYRIHGHE